MHGEEASDQAVLALGGLLQCHQRGIQCTVEEWNMEYGRIANVNQRLRERSGRQINDQVLPPSRLSYG